MDELLDFVLLATKLQGDKHVVMVGLPFNPPGHCLWRRTHAYALGINLGGMSTR